MAKLLGHVTWVCKGSHILLSTFPDKLIFAVLDLWLSRPYCKLISFIFNILKIQCYAMLRKKRVYSLQYITQTNLCLFHIFGVIHPDTPFH